MSGKSKLVLDMLQHRDEVFRGSFYRAIYCGPSAHDFKFTSLLVQAFPSIERHDRVVRPEDLDLYAEKSSQKLLMLDDFGNDAMERKEFKALFEMGSHHYNISVIVVVQNFYSTARHHTTILRNMSNIIIFNHRGSRSVMKMISSNFAPNGDSNFLTYCFETLNLQFQLIRGAHYIMIDLATDSNLPPDLMFRSLILPTEHQIFFYLYVLSRSTADCFTSMK
ncbi:uncharacterized protein LOC131892577 isoform X1 [Tigriopus californicus]|uniref:uncharacterized protein LOC131892577 isoform X1 n=1 Tax=Tigriopus californicus TaxID=6832 RepID=UPI0027D9FB85|nr:uncharacterized protein LOC131892577 isoform X1 [Tigriopus californicus]